MVSFQTHYESTNYQTRREGRVWYRKARQAIEAIAERTRTPYAIACAVTAILSQRTRWEENLGLAEAALTGKPYRALGTVRSKVDALLSGKRSADDCIRGDKIKAFYRCLLGDDNAVVIDTWMLRACKFHVEKPTHLQYKLVARALQNEAARLRIKACEYQAIVWCHVRTQGV